MVLSFSCTSRLSIPEFPFADPEAKGPRTKSGNTALEHVSLNLSMHQNPPQSLLKQRLWAPFPEYLTQLVLDEAGGFALLINPQVTLMLGVLGPHFENYCARSFHHIKKQIDPQPRSETFLHFKLKCITIVTLDQPELSHKLPDSLSTSVLKRCKCSLCCQNQVLGNLGPRISFTSQTTTLSTTRPEGSHTFLWLVLSPSVDCDIFRR